MGHVLRRGKPDVPLILAYAQVMRTITDAATLWWNSQKENVKVFGRCPEVVISWTPPQVNRQRRGGYRYETHTMEFTPDVEDSLVQTLVTAMHELAHAIAPPEEAHGDTWFEIGRRLYNWAGLPGEDLELHYQQPAAARTAEGRA